MGIPIDTGATMPMRERAAFNEAQQRIANFSNEELKKFYAAEVNNWIGLQSHGETEDPVPKPPKKWAALPKQNLSEIERDYDTRFGLPPELVPTLTNEDVAPQYVPAAGQPPQPAGPVIGVSLGGGWFSAGYVVAGHEIQDKSPAGARVHGTSRDGVSGTFEKYPAPVGPGWWLRVQTP